MVPLYNESIHLVRFKNNDSDYWNGYRSSNDNVVTDFYVNNKTKYDEIYLISKESQEYLVTKYSE